MKAASVGRMYDTKRIGPAVVEMSHRTRQQLVTGRNAQESNDAEEEERDTPTRSRCRDLGDRERSRIPPRLSALTISTVAATLSLFSSSSPVHPRSVNSDFATSSPSDSGSVFGLTSNGSDRVAQDVGAQYCCKTARQNWYSGTISYGSELAYSSFGCVQDALSYASYLKISRSHRRDIPCEAQTYSCVLRVFHNRIL